MPFLKSLKKTLADYFFFTRGQRLAFAVLLVALFAVLAYRVYLQKVSEAKLQPADDVVITAINEWQPWEKEAFDSSALHSTTTSQWRIPDGESLATRKFKLHPFDPNTISPEELAAMGFRPKSIQTLINYRSKGGKFRKPEDVMKLYGLFPDEKEQILPYVVIVNEEDSKNTSTNQNTYLPKKPAPILVQINSADTAKWKALPGIGEKLSMRIVNFREALGGFATIDQVGETYALPDSTFQKIKPMLKLDETNLRLLNLNTATYEQLNAHPYISSKQARFIINYRQQRKAITSADELLETPELFDKLWLEKTQPYLTW